MKNMNKILFICFIAIVGVIVIVMAYEMTSSSEARGRKEKLGKTLYNNEMPTYVDKGENPSSSMGSNSGTMNDRSAKKMLEDLDATQDDSQKDVEAIKAESEQL